MSAIHNVFGHDVKFDANGNPIERGIGNMTDRATPAAAEVAVSPPVPAVANAASVPVETAAPADVVTDDAAILAETETL